MRYTLAILAASAAVVHASPFPQGVTAVISPTAAPAPGCTGSFSGSFGIAVMNISSSAPKQRRQATQIADGQPQAGQPVTQIKDGQIQAATTTMKPVTQIIDGQVQAPTATASPVKQISDGQIQVTTATPVKQISDGQIQATTKSAVSQKSDGQPIISSTTTPTGSSATTSPTTMITTTTPNPSPTTACQTQENSCRTAPSANQAFCSAQRAGCDATCNAQENACRTAPSANQAFCSAQRTGCLASSVTTTYSSNMTTSTTTSSSSSSTSPSGSGKPVLVACQTNSTLALTLSNGVLKDSKGRIGYIAANYQFQFDGPPQAGAIYTSGFSVCGNGSLALGGSSVFWQCRSGSFFNLYDRFWAAQCSPVTINVLTLQTC